MATPKMPSPRASSREETRLSLSFSGTIQLNYQKLSKLNNAQLSSISYHLLFLLWFSFGTASVMFDENLSGSGSSGLGRRMLFLQPLDLNFETKSWRLARAVEEARLESVYTGNRIEGSNPSVSASAHRSFSIGGLRLFKIHSFISGGLRRTQSARFRKILLLQLFFSRFNRD